MSTVTRAEPATAEEIAELLAAGRPVRPIGGGTKLAWGAPGAAPEVELSTGALAALVEHNEGDLTAVLGAGLPLVEAQAAFAAKGQRLCLDPPDGEGRATIGGIVATGDSGPLRHRFGSGRDQILGVRIALSDGTVARAGSPVIKNVAGYDLAKLMCGALGTLGVVTEVTMRLHPRPDVGVTAVGRAADPGVLARGARALARRPLELEALDVRWDGAAEGGAVLARAVGRTAADSARAAAEALRAAGLSAETEEDDDALWAAQRARQRAGGEDEALVRVSALPTALEAVLRAAPSAVARAGLGLAWVRIPATAEALAELRASLAPAPCVLLDAPAALRAETDVWGMADGRELTLARRLKARFDPAGTCNRGRFVGGI